MKRTTFNASSSNNSKQDPKKAKNFNPKDRGLRNQTLKTFSCPLCLAPDSLMIQLSVAKGKGIATFQCGECKREGRTGAGSIQYPYTMAYIPKLQNKANVFFKFRDFVALSGLQGAASGGKGQQQGIQTSSSLGGGSGSPVNLLQGLLNADGQVVPSSVANNGVAAASGDDDYVDEEEEEDVDNEDGEAEHTADDDTLRKGGAEQLTTAASSTDNNNNDKKSIGVTQNDDDEDDFSDLFG